MIRLNYFVTMITAFIIVMLTNYINLTPPNPYNGVIGIVIALSTVVWLICSGYILANGEDR